MVYVVLRVLYGLYFGVGAFVLINAMSEAVFGKRKFIVRLTEMGRRMALAPFWPLFIFSKSGRARLFRYAETL